MRRFAALITVSMLLGLLMVPAFASGNNGNGETCNKAFPSYTKVDSSSGHVSDEWGSLDWSGNTLDYEVEDGWTVMLCIKSGVKVGLLHYELTGSDSISIKQDISHIAYKAKQDKETTTTTQPEETTSTTTPEETTSTTQPEETTSTTAPEETTSTTGPPPTSTPQGAGLGWIFGIAVSLLGGLTTYAARKRS